MSRTVAVIPAHNEAATIADVVSRAVAHVDRVLVIDDGSRDDTATVAEQAGARVIRQVPNKGKGTALRVGIEAALADGATAIVTLDADGEHDADEIPLLLGGLEHADLVLGVRDTFRSHERRFANAFALWWFQQIDPAIEDTICGFRAFRASVAPVLDNRATGFAYEHEVLLNAAQAGVRMASVPVRIPVSRAGGHVTRTEMLRVAVHFSSWVLPRLPSLSLPLHRKAALAVGCTAGYALCRPAYEIARRRR